MMENMLIERLKSELRDHLGSSSEFAKRIGRINSLVRFAIGNLRPKKRKPTNPNQMSQPEPEPQSQSQSQPVQQFIVRNVLPAK